MNTIIKHSVIIAFAIATFSCSKDDGGAVVPDPVQELPEQEVKLTNIEPQSGPKGTLVTINGTHFGTDASKVKVFFNKTEALVQSVSNTEITSVVPPKAFTGSVKVIIDQTEFTGPEFEYQLTAYVSTFAGGEEGHSDGTGQNAQFHNPQGIVSDKEGNLYVADTYNHVIRKITPDGTVTTFAGSKKGDLDGTLTNAKFNFPVGLGIDEQGNIYVADAENNKIRKITPFGIVFTLAGNTEGGYEDGPGNTAQFDYPVDVDVDAQGNILVADYYNNKIRKITPEGIVSTVAGSAEGFANGSAFEAKFHYPTSVSVDSEGNLYVTDDENYKVRKITKDGNVETFSGSTDGYIDGLGTEAQFGYIRGIKVDSAGNIWVADSGNDKIRKISADGQVSTIAGTTSGFLDGIGKSAQFNTPSDLVVADNETLFVLDRRNHRIRKITLE